MTGLRLKVIDAGGRLWYRFITMLKRFCRGFVSAVLVWLAPVPVSAFSAEDFLAAIEQDPAVAELESAIALAQGNTERKKSLSSLKKRLSAEKHRVQNRLREVKPLALKARQRQDVNVQDGNGRTLLMHAARFSNGNAIDMLLRENAALDSVDKKGCTALDYDRTEGNGVLAVRVVAALELAIESGHTENIRRYCQSGIAADTMLPDGPLPGCLLRAGQHLLAAEMLRGKTPENEAMSDGTLLSELIVLSGNPDLLNAGAAAFGRELWAFSPGGTDTLLHILRTGNLKAVQLYAHHCGVSAELCSLAVRHSSPEVVTWVLQQAQAAAKADAEGDLPLFAAARRGNPAVYEAVLAAGGDVNAGNESGETLLMHAALSGSPEMINAVLQTINADLAGACDASGRTALDYARMSGNPAAESVLSSRGIRPGNQQ